ncbi:hypothetical protein Ccrd_017473 [Cynara cardunculus var. scolymus]|uniref:Uncharacterized protein n=1 Tax=Cynara cardunculus var. scolymus TaxID=59895 RepID=A0A118K2E3_CYNCS|nr:hypothetical protein Ccrd_017473 [Cynara cardunculus var. scolymus]
MSSCLDLHMRICINSDLTFCMDTDFTYIWFYISIVFVVNVCDVFLSFRMTDTDAFPFFHRKGFCFQGAKLTAWVLLKCVTSGIESNIESKALSSFLPIERSSREQKRRFRGRRPTTDPQKEEIKVKRRQIVSLTLGGRHSCRMMKNRILDLVSINQFSCLSYQHREPDGVKQDDKKNDHEENGDDGKLPRALLQLSGFDQLFGPTVDERACMRDVALDIVQLLALGLHERRHVQKDLVQFYQILFDFLHGIMSFLNLGDGVHDLASTLILDRFLHEIFTFSIRDQVFNQFIVRFFTRDGEVSSRDSLLILLVHAGPQRLEVVHHRLELLSETTNDGRPRSVGRRSRPATGKLPVGDVRLIQRLDLSFDDTNPLQNL